LRHIHHSEAEADSALDAWGKRDRKFVLKFSDIVLTISPLPLGPPRWLLFSLEARSMLMGFAGCAWMHPTFSVPHPHFSFPLIPLFLQILAATILLDDSSTFRALLCLLLAYNSVVECRKKQQTAQITVGSLKDIADYLDCRWWEDSGGRKKEAGGREEEGRGRNYDGGRRRKDCASMKNMENDGGRRRKDCASMKNAMCVTRIVCVCVLLMHTAHSVCIRSFSHV
jgi:hypothetical protein